MEKENIKLGCAVVGAGLIGGICWRYRKKILKEIGEFVGIAARTYVECGDWEDQYYYTRVKGHWRFDSNGNITYVKPHYRKTCKRKY